MMSSDLVWVFFLGKSSNGDHRVSFSKEGDSSTAAEGGGRRGCQLVERERERRRTNGM